MMFIAVGRSMICWSYLLITCVLLSCVSERVFSLTSEAQFGAIGRQVKIAVTHGFPDPLSFFEQYVYPEIPVLIKGGATNSAAYTAWKSDDGLLDNHERIEQAKSWIVTVETQKKEDRKIPPIAMPFYEFLHTYKDTDTYLVEELPKFLARDAVMPYSLQCSEMADSFLDAHTWFSAGGTKSVVHTDDADNVLCVMDGVKEVIIIDPHKYGHLVPIDVTDGSYSSIDVDHVDLVKFPGLADVEYIYGNMSGGDCLFIPYRWIHQVRSYERNVAINIWWNHFKNEHFDMDKCSDVPYDPSLTLDKFDFKGLNSQFDTVDAVQDFVHRLLSETGGAADLPNLIDVMLQRLGLAQEDLTSEWSEFIKESCKELFHVMDSDGDGEIRPAEDLQGVSAAGWREIGDILRDISDVMSAELDVEEDGEGDELMETEFTGEQSLEVETSGEQSLEVETSEEQSLQVETSGEQSLQVETSGEQSLEVETTRHNKTEL